MEAAFKKEDKRTFNFFSSIHFIECNEGIHDAFYTPMHFVKAMNFFHEIMLFKYGTM